MNRIILYKGYHSAQALRAFIEAYQREDLILFLPPVLNDYSFTVALPDVEIVQKGELWDKKYNFKTRGENVFKTSPLCGVFSSGTSEEARLIFYSQENLTSSINGITELFKNLDIDNIFCYPQPFHTFGLTLGFACSLIKDWSIHFAEGPYSRRHHQAWLETTNERTLTLGTPTHFHDLINWVKDNNHSPNRSISAIIGGAKVKKDLWLDLKNILNVENPSIGYGATEASPGISHLAPGVEPKEDGEIGKALSHVKTKMTPEGLLFSGPNLCTAILENKKIYFPKDYLLPDLIEVRKDDQFWLYKARSKWFINRGGEKFSLEKIEQEVYKATQIEILCFPLKDERLGEELGMVIEGPYEDFEQNKAKVFTLLKKVFLRDFNPRNAIATPNLPLNENHKKDRRKALEILCKSHRTVATR